MNAKKVLGLSLVDISLLFKVPNGLSQLDELMNTQKRNLKLSHLSLTRLSRNKKPWRVCLPEIYIFFYEERAFLPSLEELINTFELLSTEEIGVFNANKKDSAMENNTYSMRNERQRVNRLRALAAAIEKGID